MILFDTSVWIAHLRKPEATLITALEDRDVIIHSAVIGELACGHTVNRMGLLTDLRSLPAAEEASFHETLDFISFHKLWGKGMGWVDMQLLASALLSKAELVTYDKRLAKVAKVILE